ncbi:MAG: YicC family protein [Firmicutes bacterium]|nr:YicC family protein [Bacillota bacterium]
MALSMTGYGRGEVTTSVGTIVVEMKAVNHRYLDIAIRAPKEFNALEEDLRATIRQTLSRGRVDVYVRFTPSVDQAPTVTVNLPLAKAYLEQVRILHAETELAGQLTPRDLLTLPEVIRLEEPVVDTDLLRRPLLEVAQMALDQLTEMRKQEGERLVADMRERLATLTELLAAVEARSPEVVSDYRQKLTARLQEMLPDGLIDEARLAQEVAILADKACITEEIVRLRSHFAQFVPLLDRQGAVGRQLDFLVQEMNREINTIGSKANDAKIAQLVVEMKSELEKIREQTQNIE